MTLGPVVEAGVGIDVSVSADVDETAAPVLSKIAGSFGGNKIIVSAGHDDRGKGQAVEGHRVKAGCPRRIRWGLGVAWGYEKSAFDPALVVFGPADDGAAGEAVADEDHVFRGEGGKDLVDGMEPIYQVRCVPIPLMDAGIAVEFFPAGLPMAGTGVIEAWKDEAQGW